MINKLSLGIATYLKQIDNDNTPSIDVMKYALYIILHNIITIISIVLIAFVLQEPISTLIALAYFMVLRFFAGGYHLHSSTWCTILSITFVCVAPFIELSMVWIIIVNAIAVILLAIYSPRNFKGYARIPEKYYPIMKVVAIAIGSSNFIWLDSSLAAILILQSALLLPPEKGGEQA